ncbi:MAG: histidine phosphatase family protein [Myxococcota bacterium]|jgi:probable phosphoglycerate mutase|nr:histidine phosphatase family protein [Myxococcota bacterium]
MERKLELWLVRHGQTVWNAEHRIAGWSDVPLTAQGEKQAKQLSAHLQGVDFDGVWSSDLNRAVETARLAHSEPKTDDRLREMNFGQLEGRAWDEIEPAHRDGLLAFEGFESPQGESTATLVARVCSFIEDLPFGRHLVVSHGGVLRVVSRSLGLDRFMGNGSLIVVDWISQRLLRTEEPPAT